MNPDTGLFGRSRGLGFAALSVVGIAALGFPCLATSRPQATPAPAAIDSFRPEVTTEEGGVALKRRVDAFVRAIMRNSAVADDYSVARWNTPICPSVVGLTAEEVKIVTMRLSQISASAGAPLARSPCQPNFIVIETSEPDRVLDGWYAKDKRLFGDATPAQVTQFRERSKSRAVRVWYNIDTGRKSGTRNGHFIPSNLHAESSVFLGHAVLDFLSIFAVIDSRLAAHKTPGELGDYVALAGLTVVDLDADLGSTASILRLFARAEESEPASLSRWDTAFLKAVYQSNQTSRAQRFDIEERVLADVSR